jgi:hypothetical protein
LEQLIDNGIEVSNDTVDRVEEILEVCLLQISYFYEPYYFFNVRIKKFNRIYKFLTGSLDNILIDEINVQTRLWKISALLKMR